MAQYLFVYGTLRRAGGHPMHQLLASQSRFVGMAHYQGRLYQVSYYPGVVASATTTDRVVGEVYQLLQPEHILALLDNYEACAAEFPAPHEYRRQVQQVTLENGASVSAWLYLYNHDTTGLTRITSGDFLLQDNAR